jgi:tetratricopeptide (TPR) repeat protein
VWLSSIIRTALLVGLHDQIGGPGGISGPDRDYVAHAPLIEQLRTAYRAGDSQKAEELFGQLPPSLRRDRFLLVQKIERTPSQDNDARLAAIEEFIRQYPTDEGIDLFKIDYHYQRKEYRKALAAVDRLDQVVGGDPLLDSSRAIFLRAAGDRPAARKAALAAAEQEPTLEPAYWILVLLSLDEKNYDDTVRWLDRLSGLGIDVQSVLDRPVYEDFIRSPQYRKWMQSRPGK